MSKEPIARIQTKNTYIEISDQKSLRTAKALLEEIEKTLNGGSAKDDG